jgi:hypothetical protein
MKGGGMLSTSNKGWSIGVVCLIVSAVFVSFAAAEEESEFKDIQYFSGMPDYTITDAAVQEFADYRF